MKYLCLLRGVNVGGKNKVPMAELKSALEKAGFEDVVSYINSGNIIVSSLKKPAEVSQLVESVIKANFELDSDLIKVCVLSTVELEAIVDSAPANFGKSPDTYHYDVIFPMNGATSADIIESTHVNPEVDKAWEQNEVVYYQRVSALRTKSRLNRIMASPVYKSTTIRNWNTTTRLLELIKTKERSK